MDGGYCTPKNTQQPILLSWRRVQSSCMPRGSRSRQSLHSCNLAKNASSRQEFSYLQEWTIYSFRIRFEWYLTSEVCPVRCIFYSIEAFLHYRWGTQVAMGEHDPALSSMKLVTLRVNAFLHAKSRDSWFCWFASCCQSTDLIVVVKVTTVGWPGGAARITRKR